MFHIPENDRIFQLTADEVLTLEPSSLSVTNRFEYSGISKIFPDKKSDDQFYFDYETKNFIFKTLCRSQLLTQLYECMHRKVPTQLKSFGPYNAKRLRKGGTKVDCKIAVTAYGLVECDVMGKVLQEYKYVNCSRCGVDIKSSAFFIEISGRTKIFLVDQCSNLFSNCKDQILSLALRKKSEVQFVDLILTEEVAHRVSLNNTAHATVSMFDVSKLTRRSVRPVSRQMHITEELIVEKDSSGFQTISNQRIDNIYAIVRSWASHREFTIEYSNGMSRTYSCAVRDTLLATLLDICHAVGNSKVIITGEISDNLRLLPRDVNEEYHSSIKDSIFGASSIESWLLSRLTLACKPVSSDTKIVELACRDFNANVPCPGIAPGTEIHLVRNALTGVLTNLHREVVAALADERTDNSRLIITLLQTLYRIIPCVHGYKCFLEVKEIDTRLLLLQLMKLDRDFVNYWTLEVLSVLCRCPLAPRRQQEEFVNKHTLLTDRMLKCLIDLMSNRLDGDGDGADEAATTSVSVDASSSTSQRPVGVSAESSAAEERKSLEVSDQRASKEGASSGGTAIASNPLPTAHLGIGEPGLSSTQNISSTNYPVRVDTGPVRLQPFSSTSAQQLHGGATAPSSRSSLNREKDRDSTESAFFPNSLVIVSAATLLESIVFSRRDTSSPELLNSFLDLLSERSEVLIHMLRSNSFLILENAAILMFILLKNRGSSAKMLKELALSEALTLKHFYNAVFSPSVNQRYISRFLVNTWVSGSEKKNPGKALLCRMIPTGLVEYLRHAPISEEHKAALDDIEDEFYAKSVGGNGGGRAKTGRNGTNITDVQARMRRRISQVLGEKPFAPQICAAHARSGITHDQQLQLQQQQQQPRGVVTPVKPDDSTDDQQYSPSQTGLMTSTAHVLTPPREVGEGAVFFAENYRVMFHMMTQNHQLPDLIWNERTRLELRSAIDNEIRSFDREQRLRGSKKVAWNFQQFGVTYESLRGEMQVGSIYIRHFLEAGDSFFRSLENPSPVVLFEKLFRRVLVNVNRNAQLSIVCCRSLSRLYSVCWDSIGAFDDMLLIVKMLDEATNIELQHCLLDLIELLSAEESNLHQLLDKTFVASIIKYASLAHLNPDQIGNVLARLTSNVLTIKCGEVSGPPGSQGTSPKQSNVQGQGEGSQKDPAQRPRSLWIPDDFACPRVWFVAPSMSSSLGALPPVQSRRGPFRVSEIMEMLDRLVQQMHAVLLIRCLIPLRCGICKCVDMFRFCVDAACTLCQCTTPSNNLRFSSCMTERTLGRTL